MKIKIDSEDIFELSDIQKKVIMNDIHEDEFDADMKRRVKYILQHKYERSFERMKQEWDQKLKSRVESLPTNQDAYAQLVFSQPDYCCRKIRDQKFKEEEALKNAALKEEV